MFKKEEIELFSFMLEEEKIMIAVIKIDVNYLLFTVSDVQIPYQILNTSNFFTNNNNEKMFTKCNIKKIWLQCYSI